MVPEWFDGVLPAVFRAHLVYRGATTHPPDPPRRGPNEATVLEFSVCVFLDARPLADLWLSDGPPGGTCRLADNRQGEDPSIFNSGGHIKRSWQ